MPIKTLLWKCWKVITLWAFRKRSNHFLKVACNLMFSPQAGDVLVTKDNLTRGWWQHARKSELQFKAWWGWVICNGKDFHSEHYLYHNMPYPSEWMAEACRFLIKTYNILVYSLRPITCQSDWPIQMFKRIIKCFVVVVSFPFEKYIAPDLHFICEHETKIYGVFIIIQSIILQF